MCYTPACCVGGAGGVGGVDVTSDIAISFNNEEAVVSRALPRTIASLFEEMLLLKRMKLICVQAHVGSLSVCLLVDVSSFVTCEMCGCDVCLQTLFQKKTTFPWFSRRGTEASLVLFHPW